MKCPNLPSKPVEPKKPLKDFTKTIDIAHNLYEGTTLQEIIDWADGEGVSYSDVQFDTEQGYYDSYEYEFSGKVKRAFSLSDAQFEKEMGIYWRKLETYKDKLRKYEDLLSQYNKDMIEYNKWEKEQTEQKELSLLEKLKKKYSK
jgi:hypothetical protein